MSRADGGFFGAIRLAEACAQGTKGAFLPRPFSNEDNCAAHEATTDPEILWQLREHDLTPDAFVAGVGTGGTVMGVGRFLKRSVPSVTIHPLEAASSPTLSAGHRVGKHRIQGISDEFVLPIVDLDFLDETIAVEDGDAIVATVFCDDNKTYLSTELLREEPVRDDYLAPHVRLNGFDVFERVCITCWEPSDARVVPT